MNLHPFLVHFPIALLALYAICELVRFEKVMTWASWFYIKAFLAIMGAGSAVIAYQFGEIAKNIGRHDEQILGFHVFFATSSVIVFGVLGAAYFIMVLNQWHPLRTPYWKTAVKYARFFVGPFAVVLAAIGLVTISLTGAFGAAMVHGPDSDFVVSFVYHLFIGK